VRARAPEIKLGLAVPRMHRNPFDRKLLLGPAFVGMHVLRRVLPRRLPPLIAAGVVDAVMVNHLLTTPRLVDAVLAAGGEIYVWTVDVGDHIERLQGWGVTGVITNDPRLFHPLMTQLAAE
jgi:glycerophosphoryl diester phosphodiesterase